MGLVTDSIDSDLVLYTHPWSRGRIARWMVEETGVPYRQVVLDYATTMKGADYLAINPMGKVPAIVHKGRTVTECAAICAYLADAVPEAGLAPPMDRRADYYRWLFFAAGPLEAAVVDRSLKVSVSDQQQRMVGYGTYERAVDVIASAVARGPHVSGDGFSAADVYVGSHLMWGMQFGTLPKRQEFVDYTGPLAERSAYRRAVAIDDELGAALAARQKA